MNNLPPLMESPPGAETIIDGRRYIYFAGTSYLGLHGHPDIIAAGCEAFQRYGLHTATTRAGFGTSTPVLEVERRVSEFFGREASFYFSSGYVANHILVPAVNPASGAVFVDESSHFCVMEAARLAGAPVHRFKARDAADLTHQLRQHLPPGTSPLVMADAVTPASGVLAPVAEWIEALRDFAPATLLLDDAHGVGVLGPNGRGTLDHFGLWEAANGGPGANGVALLTGGTLAKALGGFGGFVAGGEAFIARVRGASHYYDGASAPPSPIAAASARALALIMEDPSIRLRLRANIEHLQSGLRALGLEVPATPAAQVGVAIGTASNMHRLHTALRAEGFLVPSVGAYSGVSGEGLMRFAVCAAHTPAHIDALLAMLGKLL
jgi:8-amino-7-oxononanoate synthase